LIPDDLCVRLSVAEGLNDASDDEWSDYRGMFVRAARSVKLNQFNDYDGLYILYTHGIRDVTQYMVTIRSPFCGYNVA